MYEHIERELDGDAFQSGCQHLQMGIEAGAGFGKVFAFRHAHRQLQLRAGTHILQLPAQRALRLLAAAPRIFQQTAGRERGQVAVDGDAAVGKIDPYRATWLLHDAAGGQPLRHRGRIGEHCPYGSGAVRKHALQAAFKPGLTPHDAAQ